MPKPILVLQLRPENEAADNELEAFLRFGRLESEDIRRIRMEKESLAGVNLTEYSAIIVGGGPSMVSDPEEHKPPNQRRFEAELDKLLEQIIATDFPYLGACYGLGILARHVGGTVSKDRYGEDVGTVDLTLTEAAKSDPLTAGLTGHFQAFTGHKEACQDLPAGAALLTTSPVCPVQMIRIKQNIYATQFHTELDKIGLALRINIYRDEGYFPPEDAEKLIAAAQYTVVTEPEKILQRFIARYYHK